MEDSIFAISALSVVRVRTAQVLAQSLHQKENKSRSDVCVGLLHTHPAQKFDAFDLTSTSRSSWRRGQAVDPVNSDSRTGTCGAKLFIHWRADNVPATEGHGPRLVLQQSLATGIVLVL